MPDSMDNVGIIAQVAMAIAAVTYPIVKVVSAHLERRQQKLARRYAAPAAEVEARLIERCSLLEARLTEVEHELTRAA